MVCASQDVDAGAALGADPDVTRHRDAEAPATRCNSPHLLHEQDSARSWYWHSVPPLSRTTALARFEQPRDVRLEQVLSILRLVPPQELSIAYHFPGEELTQRQV